MDTDLVLRFPCNRSPSGGSPVLIFLHGSGERASAYTAQVALAVDAEFVGLALSGPNGTIGAGRSWPRDLASTHDEVQSALVSCGIGHLIDAGRVYLCGFSQGAAHAYGLLAAWPNQYRGAIVLSPGEGPEPPPVPPVECGLRPVYMACGRGEFRVFRQRARKWAARWEKAGQPCRLEFHAGGHHFPSDWAERSPGVTHWLQATCDCSSSLTDDPTATGRCT